jgi:CP family cyanate transporter-like MFS transporter
VSDIRDDLGLSATAAGLLTTLPVLCFGALAPVVPRLARRVPIERLLAACAAVTAVAALVRGSGSVAALFAGSCLAGVAVAIAQTALPVLIRTAFPAATGRLTGAYSMALPLGATLAAGAAVPLERAFDGSWRLSLAAWALPAAGAAALWLVGARRSSTLVRGPVPGRLRGEPLAWAVAVYFGVQSAAFFATLSWLPEMLEANGRSAGAAGGLLALASLVSMVPALMIPVLAFRREDQRSLLVAIVASATVGVTGLLVAPEGAVAWVALIGIGQGGSLGLALSLPILRAGRPEVVASLMAMSLSVGYLLAATGPWLLGLARDLSGGWTAPLAVLLAITVASAIPGAAATRARTLG